MKVGATSSLFFMDNDAWTCPRCGYTYRSINKSPRRRQEDRRFIRDTHECADLRRTRIAREKMRMDQQESSG